MHLRQNLDFIASHLKCTRDDAFRGWQKICALVVKAGLDTTVLSSPRKHILAHGQQHAAPSSITQHPGKTEPVSTDIYQRPHRSNCVSRYVPEPSHLVAAQVEGERIPALGMTSKVLENFVNQYKADLAWKELEVRATKRGRHLQQEIEASNQKIGEYRAKQACVENDRIADLLKLELDAHRSRRWKQVDALRAIKAFLSLYPVEELDERDLTANIREKMKRSGIIPLKDDVLDDKALDTQLERIVDEQEMLPWASGNSDSAPTSTSYTWTTMASGSAHEVLQANLDKARGRIRQQNKDFDGTQSRYAVDRAASLAREKGVVYPPSTIIGQYGVIRQTQRNLETAAVHRKYRRLKRHLREKNIKIDRVLSDDSEFSWDVNDDGEGSGASDERHLLQSRWKSRKWNRKLPTKLDPVPANRYGDAKADYRLPSLPSLRVGSGLTNVPLASRKRVKRSQMWAQFERQRTRDNLKDRSRTIGSPRRTRIMQRRMPGFLSQLPDYFRVTNGALRHPNGSDVGRGSSRQSSHGDFKFWDRLRDPPKAEDIRPGSQTGSESSSDGKRRRSSLAEGEQHAEKRVKT